MEYRKSLTIPIPQTDEPPKRQPTRSNNIKVICRFRPFNQLEAEFSNTSNICNFTSENSITIENDKDFETFTLDRIFPPTTYQHEIFEFVGQPVVDDILTGYNGTVFAYGQTGSGKTFTMMGLDIGDQEQAGLIPRSMGYIFQQIEESESNIEFTISCSILEIYKETLRDLLNPGGCELSIKTDKKRGIFVEGLVTMCVATEEEVFEILHAGEQNRTVASTRMNSVSSRSHQLLMVEVQQKLPNESEKRGVLNLVDLAGSEKVRDTGVTGNNLEEAKKINLSLSALGNVIHSLVTKSDHIPYRDSKLTRLLQESLGGNYRTTLIIACSPSPKNIEETINTLKFAQRAKTIKNNAKVNMKKSPEMLLKIIDSLKNEINTLKGQLNQRAVSTPGIVLNEELEMEDCFMEPEPSANIVLAHSKSLTADYVFDNSQIARRPTLSIMDQSDQFNASYIEVFPIKDSEKQKMLKHYEQLIQTVDDQKYEIHNLKEEVENLKEKLKDAQSKLEKSKKLQLISDKKAHEHFENYHKVLLVINKDSNKNALLQKENEKLAHLIKKLTKQLQDMDKRYESLISQYTDIQGTTYIEFESKCASFQENQATPVHSQQDYEEISVDEVEQSSILPSDFHIIGIPINTEILGFSDNYTQQISEALEKNSQLSKDVTIYHLKNQIVQSGLINSNLTRAVSALEWKNMILQHKYRIKSQTCKVQQKNIKELESLIDQLHYSYNHIVELMEQVEKPAQNVSQSIVKSHMVPETPRARIMRRVPQQPKINFQRSQQRTISIVQKSSFVPITPRTPRDLLWSNVSASNSHFGMQGSIAEEGNESARLKLADTNLQVQKNYNTSLKSLYYDTKSECDELKKLLKDLEQKVKESRRQERDMWNNFLNQFKENCETELIRKQAEVNRLNELLAKWINQFMEFQQQTQSSSMNLGHSRSPSPIVSKSLEDELRQLCRHTLSFSTTNSSISRLNEAYYNSPFQASTDQSINLQFMNYLQRSLFLFVEI